jgi:parvulin-like peptidyl-prolyl isomerase
VTGNSFRLSAALAVAWVLCSCREAPAPTGSIRGSSLTGEAVARVGEAVLLRSKFEAEWKRRGGAVTPAQVVEEWVHFQATLASLREAGYDRDPRVREEWERWMVARFQEEELARREALASGVTEQDLRSFYLERRDEFAIPEAVRVAVLLVKASAKATPDKRRDQAAEVETLRELAAGTDAAGFAELIRQRSDDGPTRYSGGDAGWLSRGMAHAPWEPAVLEAALTLAVAGELSPVVEGARGFYLVRLVERRPAGQRSFEEVGELIRYRLKRQRIQEQHEQWSGAVRSGLDIEIDASALEALASAPAAVARSLPALPGGSTEHSGNENQP